MRIKFTAGRIANLSCPAGSSSAFHWDTDVAGLGIKVSPGGSQQYIFQSRLENGKSLRLTIGKVSAWSIERARAESRRLQGIIDQGRDPRQVKAESTAMDKAARELEKIEAYRNNLTVQEAWEQYVNANESSWSQHHIIDHAKVSARGGQPKKRGVGVTAQGVLYPILQLRLVEVNAERLADWQKKEAQIRPTSARHGFVLFRTFWNWCGQHKIYKTIIDKDAISVQVRKSVPKAATKKSDVLQRAHLTDWFKATRELGNPVISVYLQGLLLTGARREELAELKWEDVDFKWNSLWIKDKVDAEGRVIPLTPYLASLIRNLPHRNEWVFSSPIAADGKLAEPRIAHNKALAVAGLEHVTLHGLRRTFASLAEWVEMPVGVVAQIMGHAPNATAERHYKNRPLELLAIWHGKYEAWILEQAGIEFEHADNRQKLRIVQ